MHTFFKLLSLPLTALLTTACYDAPEFDLSPRLIGFDGGMEQGIVFKDVPNTIMDSLSIRVKFQDGDGDLGLLENEPDELFNEPFFPVLDAEGEYIFYDADQEPELNCYEYAFVSYLDQEIIQDYIKVDFNPYYYNFDVELFVKDGDVFRTYDFRNERCQVPLSGRFPPLKDNFDDKKPLEGVIEYSFASAGLLNLFRNDTLLISVQIRDRSKNESNKIVSRPFTLRGIEVSH